MGNQNVKYIGFKDVKFIVIGVVALGFLIPRIFFGLNSNVSSLVLSAHWFEAAIFSATYWLTARSIMIYFRKQFPLFRDSIKRIIYTVIGSLLVTSVLCVILDKSLTFCLANMVDFSQHKPTLGQALTATYVCIIFFLGVYETIWYYNKLKEAISDREHAKVAHVQSQLDGLRNQVNPHFLFNSLNTLNYIVENEDKTVAKKFIGQLSTVYRYILESREETTINLGEELEFVHAYIAIQKERFMDNLNVELKVDPKFLTKKIIPLSLQLLIENAIKHNVISSSKPLTITIDVDELTDTIRVTNNLQKKSKVLHSTRVGLKNITDRYKLISENNLAFVDETESRFRVVLPLLN